jgi:SAM-dependent methyltransferase
MNEKHQATSMDCWLADVRLYVSKKAPDLVPALDIYAGEARFGRRYIAGDLLRLPLHAEVLEVGAGSMLLSCQLVREGFQVTALEPVGTGFSHFERMRELVSDRALSLGCLPRILDEPIEALATASVFDYAFSINVMEHVHDVALAIKNISTGLKPGASYRFTCPNYLFPYEPHFNIPTLFSKRMTEKLLWDSIRNNGGIEDPEGTWNSLSWVNTIQISRVASRLPGITVSFNRHFLVSTLERIVTDVGFASRRSKWVSLGIFILVKSRLHHLVGLFPAMIQPVIDCAVTRAHRQETL